MGACMTERAEMMNGEPNDAESDGAATDRIVETVPRKATQPQLQH